jgi:hypothetical protein
MHVAMAGHLPNSDRTQKSFQPPADAMTAAELQKREEELTEELRVAGDGSYRKRVEIEEELSEIRRKIELLGLPPSR